MTTYRGGPYHVKDTLIAARVNSTASTTATIRVKSNNYPVTMSVASSAIVGTFPNATPVAIDFLASGTYACTFVEAASANGAQNSNETLSVVIP
jgi:hypothetical protein